MTQVQLLWTRGTVFQNKFSIAIISLIGKHTFCQNPAGYWKQIHQKSSTPHTPVQIDTFVTFLNSRPTIQFVTLFLPVPPSAHLLKPHSSL